MKALKVLFSLVSVSLALPAVSAVVVQTDHPTRDLVIAEAVLAPPANSDSDAADAIQRELDAIGKKGGGTLFLKTGTYTLAKPLVLPLGVTLRGDYSAERPTSGTVLRIVGGRGDAEGPAAISLHPGAGLMGLVFWYPDQKLLDPAPYPWTVRTTLRPPVFPDNQTVADCTFVNSWRGLAIGPEGNELHTFRNLRICALETGFAIDSTTDIGRVSEVTVSPSVWAASGFPGAPDAQTLASWLRGHHTVGADYGRSDWEFIWRLRVDGYATGIRFRKGQRGLTNAVMADSDVTNCTVALDADALNGVGLAVYDSRLTGLEETVRFGEPFHSIVQFHSCRLGGKPFKTGTCATIVPGDGQPVRPEPLVMPNLKSFAFLDVTTFGASAGLEDNAPAFQKALDAAARAGGGTVYVPAGFYKFRANIRVPGGVELRGCSDVPHHTCSGGSVLMPYHGAGDENGAPFISLESGSGLRGLTMWYPEQTTIDPKPYPWTVRSLGRNCWLRDVNIGNGWQGADFATHPSDGHRISYVSGCCWRRGVFVGNSRTRGWVEDLQFNPHYSKRRVPGLPFAKNPPPPPARKEPVGGWESGYLRTSLEGFVFRDCADEQIRGTFLYAARDGIAFYGKNRAALLIHGTDTGARDVVVDQAEGGLLRAALAQLVPYESDTELEKGGIVLPETDAGTSEFHASQFWVDKPTLIQRGRGRVNLDQFNSVSGPVVVHNGFARIADGQFALAHREHVIVSNGLASVERNAFRNGALKVFDQRHRAVVRGSSFSSSTAGVKLPAAPPVDFLLDCEPGSAVKAVEGRIARQGGIRKVGEWSCRVVKDGDTHAVKLRARSDDPAYSFLYCEIAAVEIPVYPDTVLEYRFKPLNEKSRIMGLDLGFDEGRPLRECGVAVQSGQIKVGEWCVCRVPLARVAGRTVKSVMFKFDTRAGGGVFEALVDDVRFTTPNPRENWSTTAVLKDGVVTFEPPYPHKVFYTTDGHSVDARAKSFTGSLPLPKGTREFRWSPSLRDGSPSALEFPLAAPLAD
ncbi:MAG: glycosyl hydrolase family 28-related protein [Kiritimatiellia bacterium]